MKDFSDWMAAHQTTWRRDRVHTDEQGFYGASPRPWILPVTHWEEGLWPPLRDSAAESIAAYLDRVGAAKHTGVNNLKSSWIACANLYFPFRATPGGVDLLAGFLRTHVSDQIQKVDRLELEYAEEHDLHPSELLGENEGQRGKGQTSPDLAILVNRETGIVLTETKLTEHSFTPVRHGLRRTSPLAPRIQIRTAAWMHAVSQRIPAVFVIRSSGGASTGSAFGTQSITMQSAASRHARPRSLDTSCSASRLWPKAIHRNTAS